MAFLFFYCFILALVFGVAFFLFLIDCSSSIWFNNG